ncbi:hypothetical protein [Enterobacter bugandensis]|uniref:hypothetical protein n=1 Tax=Enterobacter bugandensis TaxID=881260 RepID=UPI0010A4343A|nr:hypothetical protein [Enterobacter bugandensis]QCE29022.1 hypothetical protein FAI37_17065 [Enterobacter bugandensis]
MNTKKLEKLSCDELDLLIANAFKNYNLMRMTLVEIGRVFIEHALKFELSQIEFSQVRLKFISESGQQDVTENENEFYKNIANRYMGLEREPREVVLALFYRATDDLHRIDSQLNRINIHLKELEEKKKRSGWLNGVERYDRNLYEYYRDKNHAAKDEILKFISEKLEYYAYSSCLHQGPNLSPIIGLFTGSMPYSYSRGMLFSYLDPFDVEQMTIMSNKFLDLPLNSYKEIKELYDNDKEQFYEFAKAYISDKAEGFECVLDRVKRYFSMSHIINKRRDVLSAIISHYLNRDYVSVVNMLPMQIEGIFHDICSEIGIDESRLDISSINDKLRILQNNILNFIYFEYYSFKFPVIRNIVAHGKLVEADLEQEAILLILDLLPVCEMSVSQDIPVFKKIKLINASINNDFKSLIEYVELKDVFVPAFYNLDNDILIVESKLQSNEFWAYLRNEVKKGGVENVNDTKIVRFVRSLVGRKICSERAGEFLRDLPNVIKEIKEQNESRRIMLEKFNRNFK